MSSSSTAALRLSELDAASIGSVLKVQSAALAAGQSHVDAIITFVRERAALEDTHARALQRLSRTTLAFDGTFYHSSFPAFFCVLAIFLDGGLGQP